MVVGNSARVGDSLVFNTSNSKRDIEGGETVFDESSRILVDTAFSNLEYLIKSTVRIGYGFSRTRIEHAFGQFKSQFRLFGTRSQLTPKVPSIKLNASVIIYNIMRINEN